MACDVTPTERAAYDDVADRIDAGAEPTAAFFAEHGLEFVGAGETRAVAAPGAECVVKFETERPPTQNRAEIGNWRAAPAGVRAVLAPVVDAGAGARWLVMPRADELGTPVDLVRIEDVLAGHGWSCRGLHPENIGIVDGEPRAIDYGFPCVAGGEAVPVGTGEAFTDLEDPGAGVDFAELVRRG